MKTGRTPSSRRRRRTSASATPHRRGEPRVRDAVSLELPHASWSKPASPRASASCSSATRSRELVAEPGMDAATRPPAPRRSRPCACARAARRADPRSGVDTPPSLARRCRRARGSGAPCRGLAEVAADAHRLAHRLHLRRQRPVGARELLEREARRLHDDVVDRRLERGRRRAGDVVRDLVERVADGEAGRDLRDRVARRLRRERRAARDARVHLDHDELAASRG